MTNTKPEDIEKAKQKLRRDIAVRLMENMVGSEPYSQSTIEDIAEDAVDGTDALLAELERTK